MASGGHLSHHYDHEGGPGHGEAVVDAFEPAPAIRAEYFEFRPGDCLNDKPQCRPGEDCDLGQHGCWGEVPQHGRHQEVHEGMEALVDLVGELARPYCLQDVMDCAWQQGGCEGPGNCGDVEHAGHALITGLGLVWVRSPTLLLSESGIGPGR